MPPKLSVASCSQSGVLIWGLSVWTIGNGYQNRRTDKFIPKDWIIQTDICMHGRACLDVDGNRGLNTTNDRIRNTIGTVDGVGEIQHHHITGVGEVIRVRDLRKG